MAGRLTPACRRQIVRLAIYHQNRSKFGALGVPKFLVFDRICSSIQEPSYFLIWRDRSREHRTWMGSFTIVQRRDQRVGSVTCQVYIVK